MAASGIGSSSYFAQAKLIRSTCPRVFCKKGALRNLEKFIGKYMCQSLFFNKVAGPAILLKKRPWHMCFPVNSANF